MENKLLNEEIQKFRKLSGLLLNEGPGELLSRLIGKLSKSVLEDVAISSFATLEKRGLIVIDKVSKTLKTVNWDKMAEDDLKLLFKSKTIRTVFEEAARESGVNLSSKFVGKYASPKLKRMVSAFKNAESEGLFDATKTTTTPKPTAPVEPKVVGSGASHINTPTANVNQIIDDLRTNLSYRDLLNKKPGALGALEDWIKMNVRNGSTPDMILDSAEKYFKTMETVPDKQKWFEVIANGRQAIKVAKGGFKWTIAIGIALFTALGIYETVKFWGWLKSNGVPLPSFGSSKPTTTPPAQTSDGKGKWDQYQSNN